MKDDNEINIDEIAEQELKIEQENPTKPADDEPTVDLNTDDVTFVDSTEDGDELPTKDIVKKLRADLKQARLEKEEYLTGWQRAKADYVNFKKDEEIKRKELRNYVTISLVEDLLPALDSFDMAFSNKEAWEKVDANWRNGVEYIHQQLGRTLDAYGVTKIDKIGVTFDHNLHEAIETIDTDNQSLDHTVAFVNQSGYMMDDKVIRPARVRVYAFK